MRLLPQAGRADTSAHKYNNSVGRTILSCGSVAANVLYQSSPVVKTRGSPFPTAIMLATSRLLRAAGSLPSRARAPALHVRALSTKAEGGAEFKEKIKRRVRTALPKDQALYDDGSKAADGTFISQDWWWRRPLLRFLEFCSVAVPVGMCVSGIGYATYIRFIAEHAEEPENDFEKAIDKVNQLAHSFWTSQGKKGKNESSSDAE